MWIVYNLVSKKHYEAANIIFLICKLRRLRHRVNTKSPKATLLGFNPDEIDVTLDVEVDLLNLMLIFLRFPKKFQCLVHSYEQEKRFCQDNEWVQWKSHGNVHLACTWLLGSGGLPSCDVEWIVVRLPQEDYSTAVL